MDVMLQRHCAKYIYVVPEGLKELMSDISREVLRSQPVHIYTFIADYLDALLITRENARVAARFVESITEIGVTIADLLIRTGMSREEADRTATIIQQAFRQHLAEKAAAKLPEQIEEANIITEIIYEAGITPEQAEAAALIIQNAYRNFKIRQEREKDLLHGMIDWRVAARTSLRLYRKTGVTYEEANRAATLIKAAYKGYYTRRIMKRLLYETAEEEEQEDEIESSTDDDMRGPAEKAVRIDFGTVIPHVDFDEPHLIADEIDGEGFYDSETVARDIMQRILQSAIPDSFTKLEMVIEVPEPDSEFTSASPQSQDTTIYSEADTTTTDILNVTEVVEEGATQQGEIVIEAEAPVTETQTAESTETQTAEPTETQTAEPTETVEEPAKETQAEQAEPPPAVESPPAEPAPEAPESPPADAAPTEVAAEPDAQ